MTAAELYENVRVELVFPMEHEEGPVEWICPKLSVRPAEVDFIEEASLAILENLVSQGSQLGSLSLKGAPSREVLGIPEITLAPCGIERSTITRLSVECFLGLVILGLVQGQSKGWSSFWM